MMFRPSRAFLTGDTILSVSVRLPRLLRVIVRCMSHGLLRLNIWETGGLIDLKTDP